MKREKLNSIKEGLRTCIILRESLCNQISKKLSKKEKKVVDEITNIINKVSFEIDPAINFSIPEDTAKVFDEFLNEDYSFKIKT